MSNSRDQLSPANRAMLAGALIGGAASSVKQWQAVRAGELEIDEAVSRGLTDAAKAGLVSGAATAIAGAMAGRPLLSAITILSAGAAGMYLLDEIRKEQDEA